MLHKTLVKVKSETADKGTEHQKDKKRRYKTRKLGDKSH